MKRAYIHHKDANPLNNQWNNWEVLCSTCHRAAHRGQNHQEQERGYYLQVVFKPSLRSEILERANYQCARCKAPVDDIGCDTQNKPAPCHWCGRLVSVKERIGWEDGRIMCSQCFEDWREAGSPSVWSPNVSARGKNDN